MAQSLALENGLFWDISAIKDCAVNSKCDVFGHNETVSVKYNTMAVIFVLRGGTCLPVCAVADQWPSVRYIANEQASSLSITVSSKTLNVKNTMGTYANYMILYA